MVFGITRLRYQNEKKAIFTKLVSDIQDHIGIAGEFIKFNTKSQKAVISLLEKFRDSATPLISFTISQSKAVRILTKSILGLSKQSALEKITEIANRLGIFIRMLHSHMKAGSIEFTAINKCGQMAVSIQQTESNFLILYRRGVITNENVYINERAELDKYIKTTPFASKLWSAAHTYIEAINILNQKKKEIAKL